MMNDSTEIRQGTGGDGLCATCRHAESVVSARGSRFVLCGRSRPEDAYPRYPALPVLACRGFEPRPDAG